MHVYHKRMYEGEVRQRQGCIPQAHRYCAVITILITPRRHHCYPLPNHPVLVGIITIDKGRGYRQRCTSPSVLIARRCLFRLSLSSGRGQEWGRSSRQHSHMAVAVVVVVGSYSCWSRSSGLVGITRRCLSCLLLLSKGRSGARDRGSIMAVVVVVVLWGHCC
jgi:hypothetical protein